MSPFADLVLIVLAPGQGDGVQLLKAGLMEVGDLVVVNKADRPDAARLLSGEATVESPADELVARAASRAHGH